MVVERKTQELCRCSEVTKEPEPLDPVNRSELLVCTPESFDGLLRHRPELLGAISCVVVDEAHLIGNRDRGIRLEGILTRLRLASVRGDRIPRFVLLSAVLSNTDALANWLEISSDHVIGGDWRPSAKRLLRWTEDGMLQLHAGDDPLRNEPEQILGERRVKWPKTGVWTAHHFGTKKKLIPRALENVAYLAHDQHDQYGEPVLCVCASRAKTRLLATKIADRFERLVTLPQSVERITSLIDAEYPYLRPLRTALERGVAYHNASLPVDVREAIERAIEEKDLYVVAATTTLAEGVDLPFRVTILVDWLMFGDGKEQPMEKLLFKNIAGRCGRAGKFTEGDTIIFDNPIGDPNLTSPARRPILQRDIFFSTDDPTLESAMVRLPAQSAVSTIGSQLLAAIPENPDLDSLAKTFVEYSFAHHTLGSKTAERRVDSAFRDILDDSDGEPLAIASSPAVLTAFGKAASITGLSPNTARRLRETLNALPSTGSSKDDLIEVCSEFLKSLSDVAEQTNGDVRRMFQKAKDPLSGQTS